MATGNGNFNPGSFQWGDTVFALHVGGWVDEVIMRITDLFLAFPSLLLAMAIAFALGDAMPA